MGVPRPCGGAMSTGVRIAKPGSDVSKNNAKTYVNTDTPIFKVENLIRGALDWNGTSARWIGYYTGTTSDNITFEVLIPHGLNYIPAFLAYMDQKNNKDRIYISASTSGVALSGDVSGAASIDERNLTLRIFSNRIVSGNPAPPLPGLYGFAAYIFYDQIGAKNG